MCSFSHENVRLSCVALLCTQYKNKQRVSLKDTIVSCVAAIATANVQSSVYRSSQGWIPVCGSLSSCIRIMNGLFEESNVIQSNITACF